MRVAQPTQGDSGAMSEAPTHLQICQTLLAAWTCHQEDGILLSVQVVCSLLDPFFMIP